MKAQVATEYLFIMLFATVMLVGYLALSSTLAGRTQQAAEQASADRVAREFQNELILATQVHEGYTRTFYIDNTIRGDAVTVSNGTALVQVRVGDSVTSIRTPPYQGEPSAGENTIEKEDGVIRFI